MSNFIPAFGYASFTVAASDKIATWSRGSYSVIKTIGYPNLPATQASVFSGSGANTTSAFSAATLITIQAGTQPVWYETGTGPGDRRTRQPADLSGGAGRAQRHGHPDRGSVAWRYRHRPLRRAVTATLDTGAAMDIAIDTDADDGFFWSAINTGGSNAFTVTASTGHTIVGAGAVAASSSGRFLSRRTAADTWVTYRLA